MDAEQTPLTEQRVIEIIMVEMKQYEETMSKAVARAVALNNAKLTEQLKELGVIK